MNDVLLITVDDIKAVTSISRNIESTLLEPYLLISEEFYVKEILGDALISELKNQISGNTVSDLNNTLLVQFIRPLVGYGAWFDYVGENFIKTTPKGEVLQTSDHSSSPDLDQLVFKRQNIKDKIEFFQDRLKAYLEKNKDSYPLYRSTCTTNTNSYSNGIYLGRYN